MESVKLIECPRDAWQGLPRQIPTARKVEYLRALIEAGFKHIDAVSFVSPKAIPQMADSEEVLNQLGPHEGVEIIGIVVNERGAERAIATGGVATLGFPCSISETFLRRNQNQSLGENLAALEKIAASAKAARLQMVAYISMAFGNPYGDSWSEEKLAEMVRRILEVGIGDISLADTVGSATPELIRRGTSPEVGVHLHSRREDSVPKILAAYHAGSRRFDAALGGLGGCPFAQDNLVGNIATEELLKILPQNDLRLAKVTAMNRAITDEFSTR